MRFKSKSRGLSSIENKRNDTGLRFVLEPRAEGRPLGFLLWHDDRLPAIINWDDPVVVHGLAHEIKYPRLVRRKASGPRWKESRGYQKIRRRKAEKERKLAAHRKSLHGRLVHQIVQVGNTIVTEKLSYTGWQKRYGKSVGHCAPGMFIDHVRRTVAKTGGTLHEVPTRSTRPSQFCHGCGACVPKPLSQRLHYCPCGIGPVQRDLYSAFLAAFLDPAEPIPSCARYVIPWEGAEARLRAAHERAQQRATAGQVVPQSFGLTRARARLPKSLNEAIPEPPFLSWRGKAGA